MSLQDLVSTLPPLALYALFVYIGSTIRAGKGERTTPRQVAITALAPAFVVFCVLMLLQYALESVGIRTPALPIACLGGLLGFVANWVCEGVERNGKRIAKAGALEFFADQLLKIKSKT